MKKFLITGTAGFIGFHLANVLLRQGNQVVGLDNINSYYDIELKYSRLGEAGVERDMVKWNILTQSSVWPGYQFVRMNLEDKENLMELFSSERFDIVINLAAQAGVRYSIDHPDVYIQSNIAGFFNILEACRHYPVQHLLYASSSSVYGNNKKVPFSEDDNTDNPISLYAATKKSNELMTCTYSHLYKIPATGLRFFTVYGPWGRPDMAVFRFTEAILNGKPIQIYGEGKLMRDFTYIEDIIGGITGILDRTESESPPAVMNIGNNNPVSVNTLCSEIEQCLNIKAVKEYLPVQPGDVDATFADIERISTFSGFKPGTDLKTGIKKFCDWYLGHYKMK